MGGGHAQVVTEGVDLLDIQNVLDSADGDDIRDDGGLEDMCFFYTNGKNVFLFGTSSYKEQDWVAGEWYSKSDCSTGLSLFSGTNWPFIV